MLRKLGLGLVGLLVLIVVLVGAAFGLAQTRFGKDQMASLIEGQLAGPGQTAEVRELSGLLPFNMRLGRFALTDAEGAWLEVEGAEVRLRPWALLGLAVEIEEVGAARVALHRLPPPGPEAPEPPSDEPFSLPDLPELPQSLPVVAIDRLHVDRIELGQPVLGEAAVFNLEGRAGTGASGERVEARLDLTRIDERTAGLGLVAGLDLAVRRLNLNIQGQETGGLLAAATQRPQAGALRLSLTGDGPLDDWRGKLSVDAERLAQLETNLDLAYASTRRVRIDGTFTAEDGALPPEVAGIVGREVRLAVNAGETAPSVFALQQLSLDAGGLDLTGSGTADIRADRVQGNAALQVPDLNLLSGLAQTPLAGALRVGLDATGRVAEPNLVLTLEGDGIRAANAALERLATRFDIALLRGADGAIAGARIAGGGGAEGLTLDGRPVGAGGRVGLDLAAEAPPVGQIKLDRLAITNSIANATLTAAIDRATLAGTAKLDAAVPDLAAVAAVLPPETARTLPLGGAVRLAGNATLGEQAQRIDVDLNVLGESLAGLPPPAMELLGPAPKLDVAALIEDQKAVTVETLRLDGAAVSLTGDPRLAADQSLGGGITLRLPDLGKLQAVAGGQPLAGNLELTAGLGGTVQAPAITLDGRGADLRYAAETFDLVTLRARAAGPVDALGGDARIAATRAGQEISLATAFKLAGQQLALERIELAGPATDLKGDVTVDLATTLATGRLQGGVRDLAALAAWHKQQLAGAVTLDARADATSGRQNASVALDASGIAGDFGRLASAVVRAKVTDALGQPAVDGTVTAREFAQPDLSLAQAQVTAQGPLTQVDVRFDAAGVQGGQPLNLRGAAQIAALGEPRSVLLREFGGRAAGQDIALNQPTRVQLTSEGVINLDQLDLKLGPAQVQGQRIEYGPRRIGGEIRLAELGLDTLRSLGAPEMTGRVSSTVSLGGTPQAPSIEAGVRLSDFVYGPPTPGVTGIGLSLDSTLGRGGLNASGEITGLGARPVTLTAALPIRLALEPFAFELPPDAALDGRVRGPVDLARVAELAALDGQTLAGTIEVDIGPAGTLASPGASGTVRLDGGRITDSTSGVVLTAVKLDLAADGRTIRLAELSARDRYQGRLNASGTADLAAGLPQVDLDLGLTSLRVLDSDLGAAVLSGTGGVDGGAGGYDIAGRFKVDRADIRIPGGGGVVTPPTLDVREAGTAEEPEPAAGAAPTPIRLDVAVDMPQEIFVRGRGLESEWGGQIAVNGDATAPEVTGEIKFLRGFLDLLNRRFEIAEGIVTFDGRQPPIPVLALEARTQTPSAVAIIRLRGPAIDPKLELASEPSLPQDEVVSLILFGQPVAQITPVQGLRLAAAVAQLQSGGGGFDALETARETLGVDTIDLQGGATPQESTASVGKYLSDDVYLELQRGVAPGTGKARVEVEVAPNLSVGTSVDERSQTGVDLQWRYDY